MNAVTATEQHGSMELAEGMMLAQTILDQRMGQLETELAELAGEGVQPTVSAEQLYLIELAGLVYDFGSGRVLGEVAL